MTVASRSGLLALVGDARSVAVVGRSRRVRRELEGTERELIRVPSIDEGAVSAAIGGRKCDAIVIADVPQEGLTATVNRVSRHLTEHGAIVLPLGEASYESAETAILDAGFVIAGMARDDASTGPKRERVPAGETWLRAEPAPTSPAEVVRRVEDARAGWRGIVSDDASELAEPTDAVGPKAVAFLRRRLDAATAREATLRTLLFEARDELALGAEIEPEPGDQEESRSIYDDLVDTVREVASRTFSRGTTVAVASKGDEAMTDLDGMEAWHFPSAPDGSYAGEYPANSRAAIEQLEALRARGAEVLLFPRTARWWLDHPVYSDFADYVRRRHRVVLDDDDAIAFDLHPLRAEEITRPTGRGRRRSGRTGAQRGVAACTIVSRNYLSHARVLADSLLAQEPGSRFYLLVIDRLPEGAEVEPHVRVVDPDELGLSTFHAMCFKYDVVELSTAVKPSLLSLLLDRYDESEVLYLDPDIWITAPLDEVKRALRSSSIALTPHILRPIPSDDKVPSEQDILISGAYNLGFLGVRRSDVARDFLGWWTDRLEDGCRVDVPRGLFTDQKWVDLVPAMYADVHVVRDETYNVAFWNLHERAVGRDRGGFLVNGRRMRFFHASGFDPRKPLTLSKHQNRTVVAPETPLADLLLSYARLQWLHGYRESSDWEYGWSRFDNGVRVNAVLKQLYLSLNEEARTEFGNPFDTKRENSFLAWATTPSGYPPYLSPFLERLYRMRYDVSAAFPDVAADDRARYIDWARSQGAVEMKYEPELVRDSPVRSARGKRDEPATLPAPAAKLTYGDIVGAIRAAVDVAVPEQATVVVVSRGDDELLKLNGRRAWHFPQGEDGRYAGYYPADAQGAIDHVEWLRARGADYLVFPASALWWLQHPAYERFGRHISESYRCVFSDDNVCRIYELSNAGAPARPDGRGAPAEAGSRTRT